MSKINELPPDWQRNEFMGLNVASERAAHQMLLKYSRTRSRFG